MTLSDKSIKNLKNKSKQSIWNYVTALQQLQNALFEFEKEENDPEILQDITKWTLEIGKEIEAILDLVEKITEY